MTDQDQGRPTDTSKPLATLPKASSNTESVEIEKTKTIGWFFTMAEGLGIKVPDKTTATGVYMQVFEPVPYELVARAVDKIWRTWKKASLPKPADLLEVIAADLRNWGQPPRQAAPPPQRARLINRPGGAQFEGYEEADEDTKDAIIWAEFERLEGTGRSGDKQLAEFGRVMMAREAAENEGKYL